MQDWNLADQIAGLENAGLENAGLESDELRLKQPQTSEAFRAGCWFHYGQAIVKRLNKIGLKEAYVRQAHVKELVHCLLGLPLHRSILHTSVSASDHAATVSADTRQRSTSCWTTVTLTTTTSSSNHNRINNHRHNRMTALGHQRGRSTTHGAACLQLV